MLGSLLESADAFRVTAMKTVNSWLNAATLALFGSLPRLGFWFGPSKTTISTLTWNMAAVNNNPFEYWLTHPDPFYEQLMQQVEAFVESPGAADVEVGAVFTPAMYAELDALMTEQGWDHAEEAAAAYAELAKRKIISGFLKDKELGNKRLMSMPDRVTNTIDVVGGGMACRPTVISSFAGDMATVDKWWVHWQEFLFKKTLELPDKKSGTAASKLPCALLTRIPRAKYPAISEAEEAMSLRLQTVCLAIFDAILVHMLSELSPDGAWLALKKQLLSELVAKKETKQMGVLVSRHYRYSDVLCLQEVRTNAMTESLPAELGSTFVFCCPKKPSKADQNSVVALSKARFVESSVADVTAAVMAHYPAVGAKIADGDLMVVTVDEQESVGGGGYLVASFHGDTDGLASSPTLAAVHAYHTASAPQRKLIFGLDANTYSKPKPGKQAGAAEFIADAVSKGYAASGGEASGKDATTFTARTYLQPQLQKACKAAAKAATGDKNPKDFILYGAESGLAVTEYGIDNTARKAYVEDLVLPTLGWPSDHALVYTTFSIDPAAAGSRV